MRRKEDRPLIYAEIKREHYYGKYAIVVSGTFIVTWTNSEEKVLERATVLSSCGYDVMIMSYDKAFRKYRKFEFNGSV